VAGNKVPVIRVGAVHSAAAGSEAGASEAAGASLAGASLAAGAALDSVLVVDPPHAARPSETTPSTAADLMTIVRFMHLLDSMEIDGECRHIRSTLLCPPFVGKLRLQIVAGL
jgi:hypothetical protein